MHRKYQVFISSTYADLIEERREVMQALLELDCMPAGMELFPAADEDAWSLIAKVIDDSDYYVVVVGGRYGSISADGISYTEREYDYATSKGIPVLAFIHANPGDIPAGKSELETDAQVKLEEFRAKVRRKVVKTYTSSHELGSVVSRSLVRLMREKPGEGWVAGRFALTPEREAEVEKLRAEVARLELTLSQRSLVESPAAIEAATSDLARGEDQVELKYEVKDYEDIRRTLGAVEYSWAELLKLLGPALISETSEEEMKSAIEDDIERKAGLSLGGGVYSLYLARQDFEMVLIQFRALQLIERGKRNRPASDRAVYWTLTGHGDEELVKLVAVKRFTSA